MVVAASTRALTPVAGVPMVVRSVRALLASGFGHVTVLGPADVRPLLARACAAEPVSLSDRVETHTPQRSRGTRSDGAVTAGTEEIVVVHDACRPLAPAALAAAVVDAVLGGHGVAVPVLPLPDTVKQVDGDGRVVGTPDRGALRVLQTPLAARSDLLPPELGVDPLALVFRHTAAGGRVHPVPGHPAAFAVHSAWDLELAELVAQGTIAL